MDAALLACGPWFNTADAVASAVMFLLVQPLTYFAFIRAFRYRVSRAIPMTVRQAIRLTLWRAGLGILLVGGGVLVLMAMKTKAGAQAGWVWLYVARLAAWWMVGSWGAQLRGRRLVGWIISGTALNVTFDVAAVGGLVAGWTFPVAVLAGIAVFVSILDKVGQRAKLKARFSTDPLCSQCQYNLTGNLSGICPECGTPIMASVQGGIA